MTAQQPLPTLARLVIALVVWTSVGPVSHATPVTAAPPLTVPAVPHSKVALVGSESQFNPATVLVNGGFDILRSWSYDANPFRRDYGAGLRNVTSNVSHPVRNLERIGVANAAAQEVFPFRALDVRHGHFVPNWFMHTLGEGRLYRKLGEWYADAGFAYPKLLGGVTVVAMQVLNEVVENGSYRGPNQDPIADILIFNTLGLLLFSSDAVNDFFRHDLRICYWPGQASMNILTGDLVNTGENYLFRVPLGPWPDFEAVMYMGAQGLFGLSYHVGDGYAITGTLGYRLLELNAEMSADGTVRTMMPGGPDDWEVGVFVDRDDSLLLSIIVGTQHPSLNLNLYPGLVQPLGVALGLFVHGSATQGWVGGLTLASSPVGLAVGAGRDQRRYRF